MDVSMDMSEGSFLDEDSSDELACSPLLEDGRLCPAGYRMEMNLGSLTACICGADIIMSGAGGPGGPRNGRKPAMGGRRTGPPPWNGSGGYKPEGGGPRRPSPPRYEDLPPRLKSPLRGRCRSSMTSRASRSLRLF